MRLRSLVSPPFDARIDATWTALAALRGLIAVATLVLATFAGVSLVFDDGAPLWVVLGSTLVLDAAMLGVATRLGPGGLGDLVVLFGPRRLSTLPLYGWGTVAFLASIAGSAIYVTLVGSVSGDLVPPPLPDVLAGGDLRWLTFVVVVLVGPFVEEVFFRGFLFAALLKRFGLPIAMVVSALVFGAAHLDVAVTGPAALSGAAFAWVYWRTGTLWPLILAHTAQNAIAFALAI